MELSRILRIVRREVIIKDHILRTSVVDFHVFELAENGAQGYVELAVRKSMSEISSHPW